MSKRIERASRRAKMQDVAFTTQEGKVELVRGSMKALSMNHGDLLVIRLEHTPSDGVYKAILKRVSKILRETGRRVTAIVMPKTFDFNLIPHETAVELLAELTKKKEAGNANDS